MASHVGNGSCRSLHGHIIIMSPFRSEKKELNDESRRLTGGSFVQLPDGVTHYELSNITRDQTVVLVHGFSAPYFIYDPTFHFLTQNGFRVLRYDLFGRGFSDRPHTRYNIDLFIKQLADLLDALRLTRPVNLIGLSMGGPIAATFTARYPEHVRSLTLIDPAGARSLAQTPLIKLIKLPLIAEAILWLVGGEAFVDHNAKDFFDPRLVEHFTSVYKVQMRYKGFLRAMLSSARNGMLDSFLNMYKQVGKMDVPVLLFWGRNDKTVPLEHSQDICVAIPNIKFHLIEGCGHIPHYEKPDEVNPLLLEFLRK
jgi:pimeloyl-ACP methyl ester carboxylesterase